MDKIYFVTGIDTDAGKSIVTGMIARYLADRGINVVTQKMAQTGCVGLSEDIETHRRIMGIELLPEDYGGLTCPYIFKFPASPNLAASIEGAAIETHRITEVTTALSEKYDVVIVEGVGGIMVPLNESETVADYIGQTMYPVIIVASAKLGSINHTLLTLELCRNRNLDVRAIVYNTYLATDPLITETTADNLKKSIVQYYPEAMFIEFPEWRENSLPLDFSGIFGV
ncbi:MAG: dethiobiotin synthase [Rikenellaceae bacterium]|nr:dethiobiotin synthase [Rikenellaceae bacterium]